MGFLVAGAAVLAILAALAAQWGLRPGPPLSSERAASIALAAERRNTFNGRVPAGWQVVSVVWDPSGDVTFPLPNGQVERPPPCAISILCPRRELWHVHLQAPIQPDGYWHYADIYVDARAGGVVASGGGSVLAASITAPGPPPAG